MSGIKKSFFGSPMDSLWRKPLFGGETGVFYVKKRLIRRCESAIVLQLKITLSHGVEEEIEKLKLKM